MNPNRVDFSGAKNSYSPSFYRDTSTRPVEAELDVEQFGHRLELSAFGGMKNV